MATDRYDSLFACNNYFIKYTCQNITLYTLSVYNLYLSKIDKYRKINQPHKVNKCS